MVTSDEQEDKHEQESGGQRRRESPGQYQA